MLRPVITFTLRFLFAGWTITLSSVIPHTSCSRHPTSLDSFPLAYIFFWNAILKSGLTASFMAPESTGRTTWSVTGTGSPRKRSWHQACQSSSSVWTMLLVIWLSFRYSCKEQKVGLDDPYGSLSTQDILWHFKDLTVDRPAYTATAMHGSFPTGQQKTRPCVQHLLCFSIFFWKKDIWLLSN